MTIDVATVLDQRLTGGHDPTGSSPCVMDAVHARWLLRNGVFTVGDLTDMPDCTDALISRFAQVVSDRLDQAGLDRLDEDLQVRLMLAHAPANPDVAHRVRVRTLCWAARSVQHLAREQDRDVCEAAIATAEGWVRGEATKEVAAAAYTATAAYVAATAAYVAATATAAYVAATAAYVAVAVAATATAEYVAATAAYVAVAAAAAAATAEMDLVDWLHDLLDAHEKARAVEGVLHESPTNDAAF